MCCVKEILFFFMHIFEVCWIFLCVFGQFVVVCCFSLIRLMSFALIDSICGCVCEMFFEILVCFEFVIALGV